MPLADPRDHQDPNITRQERIEQTVGPGTGSGRGSGGDGPPGRGTVPRAQANPGREPLSRPRRNGPLVVAVSRCPLSRWGGGRHRTRTCLPHSISAVSPLRASGNPFPGLRVEEVEIDEIEGTSHRIAELGEWLGWNARDDRVLSGLGVDEHLVPHRLDDV